MIFLIPPEVPEVGFLKTVDLLPDVWITTRLYTVCLMFEGELVAVLWFNRFGNVEIDRVIENESRYGIILLIPVFCEDNIVLWVWCTFASDRGDILEYLPRMVNIEMYQYKVTAKLTYA